MALFETSKDRINRNIIDDTEEIHVKIETTRNIQSHTVKKISEYIFLYRKIMFYLLGICFKSTARTNS